MANAVVLQDPETEWSAGGAILVEARGRSEPPRHLEVSTPGRGAEENTRERLSLRVSKSLRQNLRHFCLSLY